MSNNTDRIPLLHPEWVEPAVKDITRGLTGVAAGIIPEVLRGRFLVGYALRLLRCVYGDDKASVVALASHVGASAKQQEQIAAALGLVQPISRLDGLTRKVISAAHIVAELDSDHGLDVLRKAIAEWDAVHEAERNANIVNALWGPGGICTEESAEDRRDEEGQPEGFIR